jgi:hypothetical protein
MKICPLIFAVGRLLPRNVQSSGKDPMLDGEIGYGEFEFSGSITRVDYFLSHQRHRSSTRITCLQASGSAVTAVAVDPLVATPIEVRPAR